MVPCIIGCHVGDALLYFCKVTGNIQGEVKVSCLYDFTERRRARDQDKFQKKFTKIIQDTPKKLKHPLYERSKPAPPLSANDLMILLTIIISAGAFRDYSTIEDVLAARPPPSRKYVDWEAQCQNHIDNVDVPFRCDLVISRRAVACARYCSVCLGKN
ncbi:hypothetical protein K505DRAFT_276267 [Melanomma pulvis-pyrius CBS 109.77]|uniref:PiggyBac transposable element-derived protein domain-containing protein n=1 Tax=Melanomma pulvis-pyrius CBS 109.77 TaxID=1314802 RepID=A0A6A6XBD2_9PLEO|nr:hypothetical protein K505DRAFT_276267 [Melanomma pulvis-pyrius CBS 109.77]